MRVWVEREQAEIGGDPNNPRIVMQSGFAVGRFYKSPDQFVVVVASGCVIYVPYGAVSVTQWKWAYMMNVRFVKLRSVKP
jgi:hypothetical protein